ncbi:MAG: AzlD domain-containing protein [Variibacter sp.]
MNELFGPLASFIVVVLVGFLPNEVWRMLGVVAARGLDERSDVVVWVRAVAGSILAGVIAKIALFAPGTLADIPLTIRIGAIVIGFAAFLALRRSVFAGVLVGETALMAGAWATG